ARSWPGLLARGRSVRFAFPPGRSQAVAISSVHRSQHTAAGPRRPLTRFPSTRTDPPPPAPLPPAFFIWNEECPCQYVGHDGPAQFLGTRMLRSIHLVDFIRPSCIAL